MKKVGYFILIAGGVWLILSQIIVWILYAVDNHVNQESSDPIELRYLDYIASLLTIVVSIFTVFASIKQLKFLNRTAKAK